MKGQDEIDWGKLSVSSSTHEQKTFSGFLPTPIGYWVFPGASSAYRVQLGAFARPNWFHIKMMKLLLGFRWKEANKKGEDK